MMTSYHVIHPKIMYYIMWQHISHWFAYTTICIIVIKLCHMLQFQQLASCIWTTRSPRLIEGNSVCSQDCQNYITAFLSYTICNSYMKSRLGLPMATMKVLEGLIA